jgi:hypothetical protein
LVTDTRCRGAQAAGLGYISGHAGVVVALAAPPIPNSGLPVVSPPDATTRSTFLHRNTPASADALKELTRVGRALVGCAGRV